MRNLEFHERDQMNPGLKQIGAEAAKESSRTVLPDTGALWGLVSGLIGLLVMLLLWANEFNEDL